MPFKFITRNVRDVVIRQVLCSTALVVVSSTALVVQL